MKRLRVVLCIAAFAMVARVVTAGAAEEESWMFKLQKRFSKKEEPKAAAQQAAPAVKAPVATKEQPSASKIAPSRTSLKDMSKSELIAEINEMLEDEDEVRAMIQGLSQGQDPDGNSYYLYQGARIEDLDKELLGKLATRIAQERTRLRTERIKRQLETIRNAQRAADIARQVSRPMTPPAQPPPLPPPQPPRVTLPPRIPQTPRPPETNR